ncbi:MAG: LysE family transporter [Sphingobacteriaceae bacterium]|nr:LysE family transporter [Sphingobacteriaceae bacterium]
MILSLIYQTIIMVILLTFSFGPAFFALINTAIKYGYKSGSLLAVGVILSDFFLCLLVIFLVHFGAENLLQDEKNQRFAGILAGIILIVFGAFYFKKPAAKTDASIEIQAPSPSVLLFKGFFLNLFNPAVWFLWIGNVTAISKTLQYSILKMIIYFSILLGLTLLVEIFKVSLAEKLKRVLTKKIMQTVNYGTGIGLMVFGIILIYNHFFEH